MKLSVIIVSWNVKEQLGNCLESLRNNKPAVDFETIVVDNNSSDQTVEYVKSQFPEAAVIRNEDNRGFAAANNQGINKSRGEYVLLLNPDTVVHPDAIDTLIEFMNTNADAGACGPKILNEDGSIQASVRRFPTFRAALHRHSIFRPLRVFKAQYDRWLMKDFPYNRQTDVEQLMGAALLLRRQALQQAGTFDERFFMYYEEVDLCRRLHLAGWRIVFLPDASITHKGGQSAEQLGAQSRFWMLRSMLMYFRKHRGVVATVLFSCIFKPAVIMRDVLAMLTNLAAFTFQAIAGSADARAKSLARLKNSATLVFRYSRQLLFNA